MKVGDIVMTNLAQLGGRVKILELQPSHTDKTRTAAYVVHVEDHPYGYTKGTKGWYLLDDLKPVETAVDVLRNELQRRIVGNIIDVTLDNGVLTVTFTETRLFYHTHLVKAYPESPYVPSFEREVTGTLSIPEYAAYNYDFLAEQIGHAIDRKFEEWWDQDGN